MNVSEPFIQRPVATSLLAAGLFLLGIAAYHSLPVAPLPRVDFPMISVNATLPGADPETVASSLAAPLEKRLAQITGVSEITSASTLGGTSITIQFDLSRNVDGAARDVQAAIAAASSELPLSLPAPPTYRKVNPTDAPILILAMTSDTDEPTRVFEYADEILGQRLSQVEGVSQVIINGAEKSAVRVQVNPSALASTGLSLEEVRTFLSQANVDSPKGSLDGAQASYAIYDNDQMKVAGQYRELVLAQKNGTPIFLRSFAKVLDGVENTRLAGWSGTKPAVLVIVFKQAGANVIETVDRIRAVLPQTEKWLPPSAKVAVLSDRTTTIRSSVADVQFSLLLSIALVVMVIFLFLRRLWPTFIAGVTVPLAIAGTFAVMYLCGYSLDNLSLMAVTISVGFVVDDAIVVIENVVRFIEAGDSPMQAALKGARQIGFTVVSMSLSLVAVFIPLLFMSGLIGRLFHEFAVTLSAAILVSGVIALTLTPMLCSRFLEAESERPRLQAGQAPAPVSVPEGQQKVAGGEAKRNPRETTQHAWRPEGGARMDRDVPRATSGAHDVSSLFRGFRSFLASPPANFSGPSGTKPALKREHVPRRAGIVVRASESAFNAMLCGYEVALRWVLRHQQFMLAIALLTAAATVWFYTVVPKGFFPQQDTGLLTGVTEASQDISFGAMAKLQDQVAQIVLADPAVATLGSFIGGGYGSSTVNNGRLFITLKPLAERKVKADEIIARIRKKVAQVSGITLFLQSNQDIRVGGRISKAQYQYALQSGDLRELNEWTPKLLSALRKLPQLKDVTSDQQTSGLQTNAVIDRDAAARLGVTPEAIDNTLYDAFGQRQVSTIYKRYNQHHVVLEVDPQFQRDPASLRRIFVKSTTGAMVPLSSVATFKTSNAFLSVNHQGQFPAVTISFNLAPGVSLGAATELIQNAKRELHLPGNIISSFQGTAQVFQASLVTMPLLLGAALVAIYIVLGILYESLIHPLTILSTLPSAGLGALLALMLIGYDLSLVSFIGIILLMGIVKKNAIMMIDFALDAERSGHLTPEEAIYQACVIRFRPIMMTTLAALFGAVPLAIGMGVGSELRQPLGVAVVGGLIVSQVLTLFTTPVIYLAFERARLWARGERGQPVPGVEAAVPVA